MADWISLDRAIDAKGVRLILARSGIPSPWSEFCRAIFHIKKIPFLLVDGRDAEGTYRRLKPLSAQESVPVVLIEQERPRSSWLEQLYAAGRSVFVGEQVTALDLAWAAFAALLRPLPEPDCPMHVRWRELFSWTPKSIDSAGVELLLAHRNRIYREYLTLPVPTQ
jgi:hypothetical protein